MPESGIAIDAELCWYTELSGTSMAVGLAASVVAATAARGGKPGERQRQSDGPSRAVSNGRRWLVVVMQPPWPVRGPPA